MFPIDPNMWGWKWVYKTSYLTSDFGVTSYITEPGMKQAWLPHFCNQSTWLVRWPSEVVEYGSTLFLQQQLKCEGNTSLEYTPNEQVLQYEGTMLGVYNIRDGDAVVNAWVPQGQVSNLIIDSWIFMQKGTVLIAMMFANPIMWIDEFQNYERNGVMYDIVTSLGQHNAAVILTESTTTYNSLDNFSTTVLNTVIVDFSGVHSAQPTASVTDLHGNILEMQHDGARRVNSKDMDYEHWPTVEVLQQETRWISQQVGDFNMYVNMPDMEPCRYDFANWTTSCA